MTTKTTLPSISIFTEAAQGKGSFDRGKITEIKPIPFPQETGGSKRIGPLMYWAWASASGDGVIGMHPHRGFEILSYVLAGEIGHTDTGGNRRRVGKGGVQVMQTGSGISHQEEMYGERTEFFQIWFEPDLKKALEIPAAYADFEEWAIPIEETGPGVRVKHILGAKGAVKIQAPGVVDDVELAPGRTHAISLPAHHALAAVTIEGGGEWLLSDGSGGNQAREFARPDFTVIRAAEETTVQVSAGSRGTRLLLIRVPLQVEYPLYTG